MKSSAKMLGMSLAIGLLAGCGDETGPVDGFTIRGTIQNNTSSSVPAGARLLAVWVVSAASPDYTYVFGEGSINRGNGTFELTLTEPPPAAALNAGSLGVAVLVVSTHSSISTGGDITDVRGGALIGSAGSYAVIYVDDNASASAVRSWAADFAVGYGVGEGESSGMGFDIFVPTDPPGVVITIDDFGNIEFVNWT